jgi:hypothetical protein
MPICQTQITSLTADQLDPDAWRTVEADSKMDALNEALSAITAADLPCRVYIADPCAPKHSNGVPIVVHSYDIARAEDNR